MPFTHLHCGEYVRTRDLPGVALVLKVERMNLSETNFSGTAESQRLWQGAICNVRTSQFDKHWRQSQKQLQKYNIRD